MPIIYRRKGYQKITREKIETKNQPKFQNQNAREKLIDYFFDEEPPIYVDRCDLCNGEGAQVIKKCWSKILEFNQSENTQFCIKCLKKYIEEGPFHLHTIFTLLHEAKWSYDDIAQIDNEKHAMVYDGIYYYLIEDTFNKIYCCGYVNKRRKLI